MLPRGSTHQDVLDRDTSSSTITNGATHHLEQAAKVGTQALAHEPRGSCARALNSVDPIGVTPPGPIITQGDNHEQRSEKDRSHSVVRKPQPLEPNPAHAMHDAFFHCAAFVR